MSRAGRTHLHRWFAATAAALFAVWLVALTPHLVHHLDQRAEKAPACAFVALADHTPHLLAVVIDVPGPDRIRQLESPGHLATPRAEPVAVAVSRAPPSSSPAA